MRSLAARAAEAEWMDGADVSAADMAACLHDLAQANTVTLGRRPTLGWLRGRVAGASRVVRIVDVGSGEGDMLRAVHARCAAWGVSAELIGVDLNPRCIAAARAASAGLPIRFIEGDAAAAVTDCDIVLSALVCHHMTDAELIGFLGWMERTAAMGWFVNDLHRHWLAYHGFAAMSAAAGWHRIVRHDGPLSVARAFRAEDWRGYLAAAGIDGARTEWWFPFRLCVARERAA